MENNTNKPSTPGSSPQSSSGGTPAQTPSAGQPSPGAPASSPTPPPVTKPLPTTPSVDEKKTDANKQEPPKGATPPPSGEPKVKKSLPFPLIVLLLIVSFLGGLILATGYFQQQLKSSQAPTAKATPAVPQTLRIGTDATFEPMEFVDEKGTLTGYDIDLGYRLGNELETKVEFQNIPWDNLFTALEQKKIDMIISGVTITDERKKRYDFSEPYLYAGQVVIATQALSASGSGTTNLQGRKLGVQQGTTSETEAVKQTADNLVIRFPDVVQAVNALKTNQVDAVVSDLTSAKSIIKDNPDLHILDDPLTNESYGIVFRKGDAQRKQIDSALDSLKIKGIMTDLKQKWLD